MKTRLLAAIVSCSAAAVVLVAPNAAHAQASQQEMQAFPMPPPSGFFAQKNYTFAGDFGYFIAPAKSVYGTGAAAADYEYVHYTGISGKDLWFYGAWGTTAVPPQFLGGDDCGHAHASWGAWARFSIVYPGIGTFGNWLMVGGGGTSGVRTPNGPCTQQTVNDSSSIDKRFGWGSTYGELDARGTTIWKELVVGSLSQTHGWGTCSVRLNQFPACHEPSYIIGYTLP